MHVKSVRFDMSKLHYLIARLETMDRFADVRILLVRQLNVTNRIGGVSSVSTYLGRYLNAYGNESNAQRSLLALNLIVHCR